MPFLRGRSRAAWTLGLVAAFSIAAGALSAGCGSQDSAAESSDVVADVMANSAEVLHDRLVFPKNVISEDLKARITRYDQAIRACKDKGSVESVLLVGDRQNGAVASNGVIEQDVGNPYGFIRRALSFYEKDGKIVVLTERATLADVFDELEARGVIEVGAPETDAEGHPGPSPQVQKTLAGPKIPPIDLTGKEIYRKGDDFIRVTSGFVAMESLFDLEASVGLTGVKTAHAIIRADVNSEIAIEASLSSKTLETLNVTAPVYEKQWSMPKLGPIPLTLGADVAVRCILPPSERLDLTAAAQIGVGLIGGFQYDKENGAQPIAEPPDVWQLLADKPAFNSGESASLQCYVDAKVAAAFYDARITELTSSAYLDLKSDAPTSTITLDAGAKAHLTANVKIFNKQLAKVDKDLFDVNEQFVWGDGGAGGSGTGGSGAGGSDAAGGAGGGAGGDEGAGGDDTAGEGGAYASSGDSGSCDNVPDDEGEDDQMGDDETPETSTGGGNEASSGGDTSAANGGGSDGEGGATTSGEGGHGVTGDDPTGSDGSDDYDYDNGYNYDGDDGDGSTKSSTADSGADSGCSVGTPARGRAPYSAAVAAVAMAFALQRRRPRRPARPR